MAARFAPLAGALAEAETTIVEELGAVQGSPADIGGYYRPDAQTAAAVMRPSATFNATLADFTTA
jgi:isocitrate dehydrogenase